MMSYRPSRLYGADDHPACPQCGEPMHIIRRTPRSEYGKNYERQAFLCSKCRNQVERSADRYGAPYRDAG